MGQSSTLAFLFSCLRTYLMWKSYPIPGPAQAAGAASVYKPVLVNPGLRDQHFHTRRHTAATAIIEIGGGLWFASPTFHPYWHFRTSGGVTFDDAFVLFVISAFKGSCFFESCTFNIHSPLSCPFAFLSIPLYKSSSRNRLERDNFTTPL